MVTDRVPASSDHRGIGGRPRYVVAFPVFDAGTLEMIERWRGELGDPQRDVIGPHVTVVFGVSGVTVEHLQRLVTAASVDVNTFRVRFRTVRRVRNEQLGDTDDVFLIPDTGADVITDLYERLHDPSSPLRHERRDGFTPHITIGRLASTERSPLLETLHDGLDIAAAIDRLAIGVVAKDRFVTERLITLREAAVDGDAMAPGRDGDR